MKQTQHNIGGIEQTLDFGRLWFSKFFGEATTTDPLQMGELISNPAKQFDFIVGIVYAGINCHKKVTKATDLVTIDQCQTWVGEMTDMDAAELINKFVDAQKPKEMGEAPAQVENP
jgi:hypothetical protein